MEDSISRLLVFIFLGSVVQSIVIFTTFFQNIVVFSNGLTQSLENANIPIFVTVNVIVVFIYCFVTSISFTPKRIVHPLYIQIITCGIIIIISLTKFSSGVGTEVTFGTRLTFVIIVYFTMLAMLSWIVGKGLKFLIGISGNEDSLVKESLFIPISYERMKKILTSNEFCEDWALIVKADSKEDIKLKTKYDADVQIRIVAKPDKFEDIAGYMVSLIGYQIQYDSLIQGRSGRLLPRVKDSIIKELVGDEKKVRENVGRNTSLDVATELALRQTKPILRKVSKTYLIVSTVLGIFVLGMIYPLSIKLIDLNGYLTLVGTIIVTVLVAIIPMIRGSREKN